MKKNAPEAKKICTIGGQAVMEGVMMKSPSGIAMAVRRGDGSMVTEFQDHTTKAKKGTVLGWPVIRGVVTFVESLTVGMRTITRSAELMGEEIEEEPSKFEKWLAEKTGKSVEKVVIAMAVVLAIVMAVGLFFLLPTFVSGLVIGKSAVAPVWKSLTEGLVRLLIFLGYVAGIGCMKDVKRLFMYHGAEHKTIACYEAELPLTPENARGCTRFHPRCGTNYLFLVMAVSILFFAMVGWSSNFLIRFGTRLLFLPVVAGLSYEVLRLAARSDNLLCRIVRAPGVALQHITTKEPDDSMLEVAIAAFNLAMEPVEKQEEAAESGEQTETEETAETAEGDAQEKPAETHEEPCG